MRSHAAVEIVARKFDEVLALIEAARRRAFQAIHTELGACTGSSARTSARRSRRPKVDAIAATIARQYPGMRGYTRRNLFRMRQVFEVYRGQRKWTHHLIILVAVPRFDVRTTMLLRNLLGLTRTRVHKVLSGEEAWWSM